MKINNRKMLQRAFELYQAGDLRQAESVCRKIVENQPGNADALHFLGVLSYQSGNYDAALKYLSEALRYIPANAYVHYNVGNVYKEKREFDKAASCYQKALQLNSGLFEAYHNLGIIFQARNQLDEAIACYQKAVELNPSLADAYYNLGTISQDRGLLDEAIAFYRKTIQLEPNLADAWFNMGNVFSDKRQFDEAASCYQKVVQLNPTLAGPYYNLGIIFEERGQLTEAIDLYQKALQHDPNLVDAYNNLGNIMQKQNAFDKAIEYFHRALVLRPDFAEPLINLGNMMRDFGQPDEAEKCYRRALEIRPEWSFCYGNLLFLMLYNSRYDAQTIFLEHLKFAKQYEDPLRSVVLPYMNERTAGRRLKVGYVSPDFRRHPVASFIEPILAAHNRNHCEVFCYSDVPKQDDVTGRIRGYADQWRDIRGLSDEKAVELIRKDGIDILVDLAGHTAGNRLLLFARRPAPVQVSWIGYPATTGLSAMDYKIVDSYTDPWGMTEQFYTEKLIRLPDSFLCYLPESESPEVGPLPVLKSGHITFGSFNNFAKVSPEVIELWTKILKAISGSRLLMKAKSLSDRSTRDYVTGLFVQRGVTAGRIELLSWEPSTGGHLETYNRIDIALDTFPYNGTTTTCEAAWMGVPVISLEGNTHASRVGASLLSHIGIPDLIAKAADEYVAIAVNLADDTQRLQRLRVNLRDMMMHSPLTDAKRFVINLENAYRSIWGEWCGKACEFS
jgi:protein O-GlcNAc transferase